MNIQLIVIGKTQSSYLKAGIGEFEQRLKHYIKFDIIELDPPKGLSSKPIEQQKQTEGQMIMKLVNPGDVLFLLDEKGKEMGSRSFSEFIQKILNLGPKRLLFVVGGPFGFSDEIYGQANGKISFSQMTLTHEMIRLLFVEQLYRAFTILKNEKYHHD